MILARVDGQVVATTCHPTLCAWRKLICQPLDEEGSPLGHPVLALDNLGAGMHQTVLLTTDGKGIRERLGNEHSPARFLTIGIVDEAPHGKTIP